jgi:hypothetical protein
MLITLITLASSTIASMQHIVAYNQIASYDATIDTMRKQDNLLPLPLLFEGWVGGGEELLSWAIRGNTFL